MSQPVPAFLSRLSLAPRQVHKLLTVWPLVPTARGPLAPAYVTLAEAHARGALVVEELADGATVPHVTIENRGEVAVLALFGEQIQGARQNRTLNASFLIPAGMRVDVDVSCVEAGRWVGRRAFGATSEVIAHAIRRKMAKAVSASRKRGPRFAADQGEVWREIDDRLARSRTSSQTRAYADYVRSLRADLAAAASAFRIVPGQVGFVAAIGPRVVGLEAIGRPEAFAVAFPKLLDAYLVDAVDASVVSESAARDGVPGIAGSPGTSPSPEAFLAALAGAPAEEGPSIGGGRDVRLAGEGVSGCALVVGDVVHLAAFAE